MEKCHLVRESELGSFKRDVSVELETEMCSCKTITNFYKSKIPSDGFLHEMEERDDTW